MFYLYAFNSVNECKNASLNECSLNALCVDEPDGYHCECAPGFVDLSPEGLLGRVCESPPPPKPHPCEVAELNNCHAQAVCLQLDEDQFSCRCNPGFQDRSPNLAAEPGRICVAEVPACQDPRKNTCHSQAVCSQVDESPGNYSCRCRDGFLDESADNETLPGRVCTELLNECLDRHLNDCDPLAQCEDLPRGFQCKCPLNFLDASPEPRQKPGRLCRRKVNECLTPSLHNCSRFADCTDLDEGYLCRCREGYHDENPAKPGTVCHFSEFTVTSMRLEGIQTFLWADFSQYVSIQLSTNANPPR